MFRIVVDVNTGETTQVALTQEEIAALPPPEPPPPRIFSKRRFFLTLTDAEYAIFEMIEAQQPARDRRAFAEAAELNEADEDWPQFLALMHGAYGEARTAEILDAAVT